MNPILERELKTRVRTWKAPIAILLYLIVIGLIALLGMARLFVNFHRGINPAETTRAFDVIVVVQLMVIMFIVPMFTATSISGERERQTLDLMLCTDLSPWVIIIGKIGAALTFIMLLVTLAVPFLGVIFILGGVGILDLLKVVLYYFATAFTLSTVAMYATSRFKKNITAIIMSYIIIGAIYFTPIFITIGLSIAESIQNLSTMGNVINDNSYLVISLLFGANPGYGISSLLTNDIMRLSTMNCQVAPWLLKVPTWSISLGFFSLISITMLLLTKRNLSKRK